MDSSTRIADLPDMSQGGGGGSPFLQQSGFGVSFQGENAASPSSQSAQPSYIPMNVHPNPYGNQPPTAMMPPPQQTQSPPKLNGNTLVYQSGMVGGEMLPQHSAASQQMFAQPPSHPLPSRDIQPDIASLMIDERVQPNYVPPPSKRDYIHEDTEEEEERRLKNFRRKEKRVRFVDNTFVEIQKPIIIALLFMLFQLPFMNVFLAKYLFFLGLYGDDGAMNMLGHTFKSILFGVLVYSLDYLMSMME